MKKRLTLLTLFIILCSVTFAQNHNWADYNVYQESNGQGGACYTATIYVDGINLTDADKYDFAPFVGDKQCGLLQKIEEAPNGAYVVYFMIFANQGASVRFKLYDYATNAIYSQPSEEEYSYLDNDNQGDIFNPMPLHFRSIAKVGDLRYGCSLQNAYDAAQDGDVITITNDSEGPGVIIDKDVTIDFNGKTYTFTEGVGSSGTPSNGFQILKNNTVVLKNGGLKVAESAKDKFYILVQNYANLTVEDMNLDGTSLDKWSLIDGDSYVLSNNSGNVNITGNTTIIANNDGTLAFALDACDKSSWGYELPTVTVNTTGVITGAVEVSATLNLNAVGDGSNIAFIRLDGKGQLFHNGITTTIKRTIEGTSVEENGGWYTIASPVGIVSHDNVGGLLNGTHDLYRYDEETATWENVKQHTTDFTTLDAGRGYIYANEENTELSFRGTLNTAAVTQQLTASHAVLRGFNLIGNPFTYDITLSNITGAELASGFYALTKEGAWGASISKIGACQGALVKTESAATITINPAVGAKRSESVNNGTLAITVSNAKYSDVAYVSFNEGKGLDKINHRNAVIPMVYVPVDGINYAVAMMNQDVTEIPVSFQAMTMGQYTIGVEAQDCEYAMMTLVDRFTGEETNLLLEDYSFIAKTNDNVDRFIIKLALANNNGNGSENFAFINNGMMYIYNIEGQGMVNVYDVTGRPVAEYNVAKSANISTSDFAAGVYIIRMSDENGVKTQKIIID